MFDFFYPVEHHCTFYSSAACRFKVVGELCLCRLPGSGRPSKITPEIKKIVDDRMQHDDETTAVQLFHLLKEKGYSISLRTILRCRTELGWTFRGSSYCQLIRQANKIKRLDWAKINLNDKFQNVVWTDEATIQLETHRRFSCHRKGERPKNKPRYVMYSSQGISHFGRKVMLVN